MLLPECLRLLQNEYAENPMPKVRGLGGGTYGWSIGHKGGAQMNGINAFIKEATEASSPLLPHEDTMIHKKALT